VRRGDACAVLVTLPAIRQQWENFNEYKLLPKRKDSQAEQAAGGRR